MQAEALLFILDHVLRASDSLFGVGRLLMSVNVHPHESTRHVIAAPVGGGREVRRLYISSSLIRSSCTVESYTATPSRADSLLEKRGAARGLWLPIRAPSRRVVAVVPSLVDLGRQALPCNPPPRCQPPPQRRRHRRMLPLLLRVALALLLLAGAPTLVSADWDTCTDFEGFEGLNNTQLSCAVAELEPPAASGLANFTLAWALAQTSGPDVLRLGLQLEDASWAAGARSVGMSRRPAKSCYRW